MVWIGFAGIAFVAFAALTIAVILSHNAMG
jgi:hypothetical protein